jgi:hypothetical protein
MDHLIIGSTWRYCRAGDTIDGSVVSATYKPDIDPLANWTAGPTIEQSQIVPIRGTTIVRRGPINGGRYGDKAALVIGRALEVKLSLQEFTPLAFELLFNAPAALTADAAYLPNQKTAAETLIWAKLQMYNHDDTNIHNCDLWCAVSMEPYQFGEKLDPYALTLRVLHSDYNTGVLKNLTA